MSVTGKGVTMGVPSTIVNPLTINKNGQYTAAEGQAYGPVTVDVNMFSFVVKGSGSFKTTGDVNVNFGDTSADYSGTSTTVNFAYDDEKAHRIVVTGNLTNISFQNCTGLLSVDVPFPKSMDIGAGGLYSTFSGCTRLERIPSGLLDNIPTRTAYQLTFDNCTSLKEIPRGLFDKAAGLNNLRGCFQRCTSLTAIPGDIFDQNDEITIFQACFNQCTALTGPAPELWDTTRWPRVQSYELCFYGCTGLSNYADIPSGWKDAL